MATFWLTFRIANRAGGGLVPRSYETRLKALNEAVGKYATRFWDDTTSFYAFTSNSSFDQIAASVKSAIDERIDLVLIGSMDTKGGRLIGYTKDEQTLITLDGSIKRY